VAFYLLVVAAAAVLNLLCSAAANADILDDQALKSNRGPAVVRIENAQGVVRGYGVVINTKGHVLTAAHVVKDLVPNGIRGRLAPWKDSSRLTLKLVDRNEDRSVDIALLQIQGPFKIRAETIPMLVSSSDLTLANLRMLTGSPGDVDSLISLDAKLTINANNFLEVRGSINSGVSGSPLFDSSGNLVGVVVEGLPGQTTAYVRPVEKLKNWLRIKKEKVSFEEAPPAPVMIGIYFSIPSYAPAAIAELNTKVIAPLKAALSKSLKDHLTPEPEVITDSKSLEKWSPVANALFDDIALPPEQRLDKAKRQLLDLEYMGWLRKMAFSQLYLLIIRVEKEDSPIDAALKPGLLIITQLGDKVELEYAADSKAKLKLYPPPDYKPGIEPPWSMENSLAVELVHIIVRKRPGFARNNRVFADCIRFPGLDYAKDDSLYFAPNRLETQLSAVFEANQKQIKVRSASDTACREAVSRKIPRYLWPHHLNEYIVDAAIIGNAVHWRAGHPWDDEEDHPKEETRADANPEGRDDFAVKALATDIDRKWLQILDKINGATR
jgi:hypothetical protein